MKKIRLLALSLLSSVFGLTSCGNDMASQIQQPGYEEYLAQLNQNGYNTGTTPSGQSGNTNSQSSSGSQNGSSTSQGGSSQSQSQSGGDSSSGGSGQGSGGSSQGGQTQDPSEPSEQQHVDKTVVQILSVNGPSEVNEEEGLSVGQFQLFVLYSDGTQGSEYPSGISYDTSEVGESTVFLYYGSLIASYTIYVADDPYILDEFPADIVSTELRFNVNQFPSPSGRKYQYYDEIANDRDCFVYVYDGSFSSYLIDLVDYGFDVADFGSYGRAYYGDLKLYFNSYETLYSIQYKIDTSTSTEVNSFPWAEAVEHLGSDFLLFAPSGDSYEFFEDSYADACYITVHNGSVSDFIAELEANDFIIYDSSSIFGIIDAVYGSYHTCIDYYSGDDSEFGVYYFNTSTGDEYFSSKYSYFPDGPLDTFLSNNNCSVSYPIPNGLYFDFNSSGNSFTVFVQGYESLMYCCALLEYGFAFEETELFTFKFTKNNLTIDITCFEFVYHENMFPITFTVNSSGSSGGGEAVEPTPPEIYPVQIIGASGRSEYSLGEYLDPNDFDLEVLFSDGNTYIVHPDYINGDTSHVGSFIIDLYYAGLANPWGITVVDNTPTSNPYPINEVNAVLVSDSIDDLPIPNGDSYYFCADTKEYSCLVNVIGGSAESYIEELIPRCISYTSYGDYTTLLYAMVWISIKETSDGFVIHYALWHDEIPTPPFSFPEEVINSYLDQHNANVNYPIPSGAVYLYEELDDYEVVYVFDGSINDYMNELSYSGFEYVNSYEDYGYYVYIKDNLVIYMVTGLFISYPNTYAVIFMPQ